MLRFILIAVDCRRNSLRLANGFFGRPKCSIRSLGSKISIPVGFADKAASLRRRISLFQPNALSIESATFPLHIRTIILCPRLFRKSGLRAATNSGENLQQLEFNPPPAPFINSLKIFLKFSRNFAQHIVYYWQEKHYI